MKKNYRILYLFQDLLDFDGTRGDMIYFLSRLKAYDIPYTYVEHHVGEEIDVTDFDFIYAGVCPQKYEALYLQHLQEDVRGLQTYIEAGKTMLAIEQSFLFLGQHLQQQNKSIPLLGILPFDVQTNQEYTIGNILLDVNMPSDFSSKVNGFFNSRFTFDSLTESQAFGRILLGQGFLWDKATEGFVYKGFVGTQLRGPLLPRNYDVCDWLIASMTGSDLPAIASNLEQAAKAKLTADAEAFIESGEQKKEYVYVS